MPTGFPICFGAMVYLSRVRLPLCYQPTPNRSLNGCTSCLTVVTGRRIEGGKKAILSLRAGPSRCDIHGVLRSNAGPKSPLMTNEGTSNNFEFEASRST
jgi:hypothetical protein